MHKYRVIDRRADRNLLLLEGGVGRFHWARVLNEAPQVGDFVCGSRPHLGFGLLLCQKSSRTFRVIFETINGVDATLVEDWARGPEPSTRRSTGPAHQ